MKIYLVGGAVRDELLGYPTNEYDYVVVGATPALMESQGFTPVGKDFPVFLHPDTKDEYALARTERKSGRGYKGFTVNASPEVTLEEDLIRRDLTINAIAKSDNGDIIDPYHGAKDIQGKILRHVSEAFSEDPVRILRVARFAARYHRLGFSVAPETMTLMVDMVKGGEAAHLIAERVWKEFSRALTETSPHVFIQTLRDCDALKAIMPEIDRVIDSCAESDVTPIDKLEAAAAFTKNTRVRFAILLYDMDKTAAQDANRQRILPAFNSLNDRLCTPNIYKELCELVIRFGHLYENISDYAADEVASALKQIDVLRKPERFNEYLECCELHARITSESRRTTASQGNRQQLEKAAHAFQSVKPEPFIQAGLRGKALGDKINDARIDAVAKALQKRSGNSEKAQP